MKKQILIIAILFFGATGIFAQVSKGDIELVQKYFGVEKAALLKEYMAFTPKQDSAFWPVYNKYETERLALASQRFSLVDEYLKKVKDVSEADAVALVDKAVNLEINFKKLQKKYFMELTKKIGTVKAAQFYQFETYINNVINLSVQENIPFIGDMEQKHDKAPKK